MSRLTPTQIEVHLFRRRAGRVEFLCLRRAPGSRLPGVWQPVTGTLRRGERAVEGAAREVREETGLSPRRWWALESVSVWFDARANRVHVLPLFAAEAGPADRVALSGEHDAHRWLAARSAGREYLWEAQRRALEAVRREILRGGPLARALDVTDLLERSRRPARGRRRARALR